MNHLKNPPSSIAEMLRKLNNVLGIALALKMVFTKFLIRDGTTKNARTLVA